jgi:hypothetical protein
MAWYIEVVLKIIEKHYKTIPYKDSIRHQLMKVNSYLLGELYETLSLSAIFTMLSMLEKWLANTNRRKLAIKKFPAIFATALLIAIKTDSDECIWNILAVSNNAPLDILKTKKAMNESEREFLRVIDYQANASLVDLSNIVNQYFDVDKLIEERILQPIGTHVSSAKLNSDEIDYITPYILTIDVRKKQHSALRTELGTLLYYSRNIFYADHIAPIKNKFIELAEKPLLKSKHFPRHLKTSLAEIKKQSTLVGHKIFAIESKALDRESEAEMLKTRKAYIEALNKCHTGMENYLNTKKPSLVARILSNFSTFYQDKVEVYDNLKQYHKTINHQLVKARETFYYNFIMNDAPSLHQTYTTLLKQKYNNDLAIKIENNAAEQSSYSSIFHYEKASIQTQLAAGREVIESSNLTSPRPQVV